MNTEIEFSKKHWSETKPNSLGGTDEIKLFFFRSEVIHPWAKSVGIFREHKGSDAIDFDKYYFDEYFKQVLNKQQKNPMFKKFFPKNESTVKRIQGYYLVVKGHALGSPCEMLAFWDEDHECFYLFDDTEQYDDDDFIEIKGKFDLSSLNIIELEKQRMEWSLKTFPEATAFSSIEKLIGEAKEIQSDIVDGKREALEYADALMCLFDSAGRQEVPISPEEIFIAFAEKLAINKERVWIKNPDNTYSHVKQ